MINFFRNMRKKLADEDRPIKYLRYAIGEILLVVIGILIALQINNSNEGKKQSIVEQQYLRALKEEFEKNLVEIDRVIDLCDIVFLASKKVINKTDEHGNILSVDELQQTIRNTFRYPPKFIQSPGILNDLINSGNLSKLENVTLRSQIQKWFITIQVIKDEEKELWWHREKVINLFQQEFAFRNFLIDINEESLGYLLPKDSSLAGVEFSYNDKFDNLLLFYTMELRALQLRFYPALKENIEYILMEIDISLDQ